MKIIVGRVFDRRDFRFTEIDTDRDLRPATAAAQFAEPGRDDIGAVIVEAKPIDERLLLWIAKDPWPRISRLRFCRDRADFHEAKAERGEGRDCHAVFVEAGGESDEIGRE